MILGNFRDLSHDIKMCYCNNYRRLHGKHAHRWRHRTKEGAKNLYRQGKYFR